MKTVQPMYYVVSRSLAAKMQGSKCGSNGGSMYAVFASAAKAAAFIEDRKLKLVAVIVEQ